MSENSLGKGEVVSSILTGSTDKTGTSENTARQDRAEQSTIVRANAPQIRPACSPIVHAGMTPRAGIDEQFFGTKQQDGRTVKNDKMKTETHRAITLINRRSK